MNGQHHDVIVEFVKFCDFTSFLELGIGPGHLCPKLNDEIQENSHNIRLERIVGVDQLDKRDILPPGGKVKYFHATTDEFFKDNTEQFDCVFIDAKHEYKQCHRDFNNSLEVLTENGLIFLHDTYPGGPCDLNDSSSGDVYRTYIDLVEREDLEVINIPFHLGLCIVRRVDPNNRILTLKGHV